MLVNGLEAWVETPAGRSAISAQKYGPDVVSPEGVDRIELFQPDPWPRWVFRLEDGFTLEHQVFVSRASGATALSWRLTGAGVPDRATLCVRPLLSGRDYHSLHHENPDFRFEPERRGVRVVFHPYPGVPGIVLDSNGDYEHDPLWYRDFVYDEERDRGLDFSEDLASPGVLRFDLVAGPAVLLLSLLSADSGEGGPESEHAVAELWRDLKGAETRRRSSFRWPLERAGDDYLVARGGGRTIVAGYPWFTDWGRDTFISMRGLCIATGRLAEASGILGTWAGAVSEGMLPNRFPDSGAEPEYNSVDASLWFVVAVYDYLLACERMRRRVSSEERARLESAVDAVLEGYEAGTRYGIRAEEDGLLAAGVPGIQLTWMDAKVGDRVITPRIGKPVEVQALWVNALRIGGSRPARWRSLAERAAESFRARFWNESAKCLFDVVDADHLPGAVDASVRPNQIFAVAGLPFPLLEGQRARDVVRTFEEHLWTPAGPRSLAPDDPSYVGTYEGGVESRDGAYHQGTVWPWLAGAFLEARVRVAADPVRERREVRKRFFEPLLERPTSGLGHLPEIADGDSPHRARGCPFQAWSVGEALRLHLDVLSEKPRR